MSRNHEAARDERSRASANGELGSIVAGKRRVSKRSKTATTASSIDIIEIGGSGLLHNRSISNQNETSNMKFNTNKLVNNGDKANTSVRKRAPRTTKKGNKRKSVRPKRKTKSQIGSPENVTSKANHKAEPKEDHAPEPGLDHEDAFEVDHDVSPEVDQVAEPGVDPDHEAEPERFIQPTFDICDGLRSPDVVRLMHPRVNHKDASEEPPEDAPEVNQVAEPEEEYEYDVSSPEPVGVIEGYPHIRADRVVFNCGEAPFIALEAQNAALMNPEDQEEVDHDYAPELNHAPAAEVDLAIAAEVDPAIAADVDPAIAAEVDPAIAAEGDPAIAAEVDPAIAAEVDPAIAAEVDPAIAGEVDLAIAAELDPAPLSVKEDVDPSEPVQVSEQDIFTTPKAPSKRRYNRKKETPLKPTPTPNSSKNDVPKTDSETLTPQRRSQRAFKGVNKRRNAMRDAELLDAKVPKKKSKVAKSKEPPVPREKKQKVMEKKNHDSVKTVAEKKGKKRKSEEKGKEDEEEKEKEEKKEDSSGGESDSSSDFDYNKFGGYDKYQAWKNKRSSRPNTFAFENEPLILRNDFTYAALRSNDAQIKSQIHQLNKYEAMLAAREDEFHKNPRAVYERLKKSGERIVMPRFDTSTRPLELDFSESLPVLTGRYIEDTDTTDGYDTDSDTEEATQSNGLANSKRSQIWTSLEQKKFEELMVKHQFTGNSMERSRKIASELGTRSAEQVRSHMQTNIIRLQRKGIDVPGHSRRYKRYQNSPKRSHNNPHSSSSTALRKLAQQQHHNKHEQPTTSSTTTSAPSPEYDSDSDSIVYPEDYATLAADPSNASLIKEWKELAKKKQRLLKKAEKEEGGVHEGFMCLKCKTAPISGLRFECKHCREYHGIALSLCGSCMKMSRDGVINISYDEHQHWHRFNYIKPGYIVPESNHHKAYSRKIVDQSWVPK